MGRHLNGSMTPDRQIKEFIKSEIISVAGWPFGENPSIEQFLKSPVTRDERSRFYLKKSQYFNNKKR